MKMLLVKKLLIKVKKHTGPVININTKILLEIASRYNTRLSDINLIRQNKNSYIFELDRNRVLRVSASDRQSYDSIKAKIDWQLYISSQSINVVNPLSSYFGNFAEKIELNKDYYTAVVFEKAPGKIITDLEWTPKLFQKIGELTGQLHAATKKYIPSNRYFKRKIWHEAEPEYIKKHISKRDQNLIARFSEYLELPLKTKLSNDNFGLIHNDIHIGNMLWDSGNLTLFDFEDCCYSWFANDVACIIYNALLLNKKPFNESKVYLQSFMVNFWIGYNKHNILINEDINLIPNLIGARAISVYAYLNEQWKLKILNNTQRHYLNMNRLFANYNFSNIDVNIIKPNSLVN